MEGDRRVRQAKDLADISRNEPRDTLAVDHADGVGVVEGEGGEAVLEKEFHYRSSRAHEGSSREEGHKDGADRHLMRFSTDLGNLGDQFGDLRLQFLVGKPFRLFHFLLGHLQTSIQFECGP